MPESLLKQILANEVFPAIGCTEPGSCAYAAAVAAHHLGRPVEGLDLRVDMGTYKNGAVTAVPHCRGARGNLAAAAAGAVLARPEAQLELLRDVTPEVWTRAQALLRGGTCSYAPLHEQAVFRVEATVSAGEHRARCVLSGGHARIERIELDGEVLFQGDQGGAEAPAATYRDALRAMSLAELLGLATALDGADRRYLQEGVEMNLAMVGRGMHLRGAGYPLRRMHALGVVADDLVYRIKTRVAAAVDARMAGAPHPVMTSGGSGNQGLLAVLTPYYVAQERHVPANTLEESLAVAHVLNAYAKCYMGELSVICGCAVAAALAAAGAVVYQHAGAEETKIGYAVQNVIADLSGLICDGAKPGCAVKTVTGVDAALRAAFMALEGYCVSHQEGVLGATAEQSIRNLGRVSLEGMLRVDPTVVAILAEKAEQTQGKSK